MGIFQKNVGTFPSRFLRDAMSVCLSVSRLKVRVHKKHDFAAAFAVMRCLSVCVCVSVCLSRAYILSKRINISSIFFHRRYSYAIIVSQYQTA